MNTNGYGIRNRVISASRKNEQKFSSTIDNFEDRGILNSEMLCVCSLVSELKIDLLIESGRYRGQSTEILAKYFKNSNMEIISIELLLDENSAYVEAKMKKYPKVKLLYGDATVLIPKLVKRNAGRRVGILFDGPKGKQAVDIFTYCLALSQNLIVGFFHDMRTSSIDLPNNSRLQVEQNFRETFFTDENAYVKMFGYLDDACLGKFWKPYELNGKIAGSYGPTLGIVLSNDFDFIKAKKNRFRLLVNLGYYQFWSAVVVFAHDFKKIIKL
jgi:hypothetical protein